MYVATRHIKIRLVCIQCVLKCFLLNCVKAIADRIHRIQSRIWKQKWDCERLWEKPKKSSFFTRQLLPKRLQRQMFSAQQVIPCKQMLHLQMFKCSNNIFKHLQVMLLLKAMLNLQVILHSQVLLKCYIQKLFPATKLTFMML